MPKAQAPRSLRGFDSDQCANVVMTEAFNKVRWEQLWAQLGGVSPAGSFEELRLRYGEPHRAYHTGAHIEAALHQFDDLRELARHPSRVELALWMHDVIYDVPGSHNEALSAALALRWLAEAGLCVHGPEVVSHIVATAHGSAVTDDPDGWLVADMDLSILAQDPSIYDAYRAAVRREYACYDDGTYFPGRAKVLEGFLALPSIYQHPNLRERWEQAARDNLRRELDELHAFSGRE